MTYDIFVSYSRKDSAIVDRFVNRFEMDGLRVWVDREGIETGDAFKRVIVKAIKESALLVFFSSKDSNASPWTAKEIGLAVNHGKPIIPVKIDLSPYNEEVEFDLVGLDYIDYTNPATQGSMMEKLVRVVKRKQYSPKQKPETTHDYSSEAATGQLSGFAGASPYGQTGFRTGGFAQPVSGTSSGLGGYYAGNASSQTPQGGTGKPASANSYWKKTQHEPQKGTGLIVLSVLLTLFFGYFAFIPDIFLLSKVRINGEKYPKYTKTARIVAIVSLCVSAFWVAVMATIFFE